MSEKLWVLTVTVALSSLVILGFFVLTPIMSDKSTMTDTKMQLDKAANKLNELRQSDTSLKETVIDGSG